MIAMNKPVYKYEGGFKFDKEITDEQHIFLNVFLGSPHIKLTKEQINIVKEKCKDIVDLMHFAEITDDELIPLKIDSLMSNNIHHYFGNDDVVAKPPSKFFSYHVLNHGGSFLSPWGGGDKWRDGNLVEELKYIIEKFVKPWGYSISGDVYIVKEKKFDDIQKIEVIDNEVKVFKDKIVFEEIQ